MPNKDLIHRRMELARQKDIPDMQAYADEWCKLGADFEAEGSKANAAICFSNWQRYLGMCGTYKRMFYGSIARIEPTDGRVLVNLDGVGIRFPDVDTFASWLAGQMD